MDRYASEDEDTPTGMCSRCMSINVENTSEPDGYRLCSIGELRDSQQTCSLCRYLWRTSPSWSVPLVDLRQPDGSVRVRISDDIMYVDVTDQDRDIRHITDLLAYTDEGDPAASLGVPICRKLPVNTRSKQSLATALEWIKQCDCGSEDANPRVASPLPHEERPQRLIRLAELGQRGREHISLFDASEVTLRYATLSHTWGRPPWRWRTTKTNVQGRYRPFPLTELPKTLEEACSAAHDLGFDWLWIDSLCIVQDDEDEWAVEAAKMSSIYRYSALTIAACAGSDNHSGLYNQETVDPTARWGVGSAKCLLSTGEASTLHFLRWQTFDHRWIEEIDYCALAQRAWVCQERILSPRTLYYGKHQIYWECAHHPLIEDGMEFWHPQESMLKTWWPYVQMRHQHEILCSEDSTDAWQMRKTLSAVWYQSTVEWYSQCQLTHVTDKLVAIAGLARILHNACHSRYVAGLWLDELPIGLCWCSRQPTSTDERVSEYRAPSWSWASHNGGCDYSGISDAYAIYTYLSLCRILDVDIHLASKDPFGKILDATLKIRGSTFECKIIRAEGDSFIDAPAMHNIFIVSVESVGPSVSADHVLPNEHPVVVLLLVHCKHTEEVTDIVFALMLEPYGTTEDTMRRVGICKLRVKDGVDLADHYGSTLIERTLLLK